MTFDTYVGIDLTDCYAGRCRAVDVAVLRPGEPFVFTSFSWPKMDDGWAKAIAGELSRLLRGRTCFVVDGPQALAAPERGTREVERLLGTPAHTPWTLTAAEGRPFAGYIKTSVGFFAAAVDEGKYRLPALDGTDDKEATLYEAYPGSAWKCLAGGPLPSKSTVDGRRRRTELLISLGCAFPTVPGHSADDPWTHDQLDAALCAVLGWKYHDDPNGNLVQLVGVPVNRDQHGQLREGEMLQPVRAQVRPSGVAPGTPTPRVSDAPTAGRIALPPCDWVYYAGPAKANPHNTFEVAAEHEIIVRTLLAQPNNPIHHVDELRRDQTILLLYGKDNNYRPLCQCRISDPGAPVRSGACEFPAAVCIVDPALSQHLTAIGYDKLDPVLHCHTAIPVTMLQDLRGVEMLVRHAVPYNNALHPWANVFP